MRLGIVASRFNEGLCAQLLQRAKAEAAKLGVKDLVVESVPGALEIPLALHENRHRRARGNRPEAPSTFSATLRSR